MRTVVAIMAVLPLVAACSSSHPSSLSGDDLVKAEAVARQAIAGRDATITSATVIVRRGEVGDSNTGHPCTSGRELQVKLIGSFPHDVTSGHPVRAGEPTPDFRVHAIIITADADSGEACLISVQDGENGGPKPLPGGPALHVE